MTVDQKGDTGAAVLALILATPSILWHAFVASKLWAWFVVPQFGAKPLHIAGAVGLAVLIGLWFKPLTASDGKPTTWESVAKAITTSALAPAMALFIGWIAQHWVAR